MLESVQLKDRAANAVGHVDLDRGQILLPALEGNRFHGYDGVDFFELRLGRPLKAYLVEGRRCLVSPQRKLFERVLCRRLVLKLH